MKTIGDRLLYLINTQGVSMKKFCEENDLSYQSINPICNNKREIGIQIIHDLMRIFPTLNINWLIYGTGTVNYTKNDSMSIDGLLQEPGDNYGRDLMEDVFLKYLDTNLVRNKVLEIVHDEKK